jgi:AbrB family looped-hinge helix DNA binding protein
MQLDFTRISSKGQIVLPREMRKSFRQGEKLLLIKEGDNIILKKAEGLRKNLEEDLAFAQRTEAAWKRYDAGKSVKASKEKFLTDLEKW